MPKTNIYSHIAERIRELAFSVSNDNSGDALFPPTVLSSLRISPVGVPVLLREDLPLQSDQVARLAVAAILILGWTSSLFGDFILIDNSIEVRGLVVPVLDGLVIGDLNTVHLQLEVVPLGKSFEILRNLKLNLTSCCQPVWALVACHM